MYGGERQNWISSEMEIRTRRNATPATDHDYLDYVWYYDKYR